MFAILVRLASYHSLGQLFTFELSIQDKHKLVTSGPYNIVRHPRSVGQQLFILSAIHRLLWRLS